ncbi:hypothetical protein PVAND_012677 [Polypedilum vanderplanki]|uniref:Uncharacterized protein n=1 Tax=Polypedilum vanderplanki TaxID=319348 RepID=A0A9J6CN68_POLVA|nr:hypothetical protein PVAND_012677 [Polypedilum vanderplanki]
MFLNYQKVPKPVYFILAAKFMEIYCSNGISAILVVYLNKNLNLDESTSTSIYHMNEVLSFLFPLFGAIIAESYYGLFKTITAMCLVTFISNAIVAGSTLWSVNNFILSISLFCLSIIFASLGSIRSNLVTFGADQYQGEFINLKIYFSLQMFVVKIGSLIGRITTPIFREDFKCFNVNSCYFLAFGVPALAILFGFLIMMIGRKFFICKQPTGNLFVKTCHSIFYALKFKIKNKNRSKSHWMNYAEDKFGRDHVDATKTVLETLLIILPTAIYWAVFMQQGSRWIFQAMRMNGNLGFMTLKPDQMIAMNSVFSILLLPICTQICFPLLDKIGLKSLLHRIAIGGFLCCISFIMAAFVEIYIQKNFISMLWLIPQFAILALSENFVYISLIEFAYSETPDGMKSIMTSVVFLIIALGNLFITVISGLKLFETQVYEYLFFACILFVDMIIFIVLSNNYNSNKIMITRL